METGYDGIPVYYCKDCLSLRIRNTSEDGTGVDYCDECGSANVGQALIAEWVGMKDKR